MADINRTLPPCPNHGCGMIRTNEPTIYICPISGCRFGVDVESPESDVSVVVEGGQMVAKTTYKPVELKGKEQ